MDPNGPALRPSSVSTHRAPGAAHSVRLGQVRGDAAAGPGTTHGETDLADQWENHGRSCRGLASNPYACRTQHRHLGEVPETPKHGNLETDPQFWVEKLQQSLSAFGTTSPWLDLTGAEPAAAART